jgi:spore maturation protein CgeB
MRILACSHAWQGANCYSFVRAFRRAGHSVQVMSDRDFVPQGIGSLALRAARRLVLPLLVEDYQRALIDLAARFRPHVFFVYKGTYVKAATIEKIKSFGAIAINVYPDVGFASESPWLAPAMSRYHHVFTTKSFRMPYMRDVLGVENLSFMPHAFDPEIHNKVHLEPDEVDQYKSDVAFIGTWSPKKGAMMEHIRKALPQIDLKIWGNQWERGSRALEGSLQGGSLNGVEYSKGLSASKIAVACLVEASPDSMQGDKTTSRTFEIPAIGAFMLHERTDELGLFFKEGLECATFGDNDDLVNQIRRWLNDEQGRARIAENGYHRAHGGGYSFDTRVEEVMNVVGQIAAGRRQSLPQTAVSAV